MNPQEILRDAQEYYRAMSDTRAFCERYLSDGPMETRTFGWYTEADKVIAQPDRNQRQFAFICVPPGFGKTRGYTVVESARRISADRTHRIGLFSKNKDKAANYMRAVMAVLKYNQKLTDDCGVFLENSEECVANSEKIIVLGHPKGETTPSIANLGMTSQVESLRFHTMILDDPIDREIAFSEAEVEHFISRMKNTFIPRLEPGGQMIIIGSRFSATDGYHWVVDNPLFKDATFVSPALNDDGESLCPERFSAADLLQVKNGMMEFEEGEIVQSSSEWEARFMQNPSTGAEMAFRWDWINPDLKDVFSDKWTLVTPENNVVGIDPAYSTSKHADYTGGAAIGKLGKNPVLFDVMAVRISSGFKDNVNKFQKRNSASRCLVEINNARTFGDDLRRDGIHAKDIVQTTGKTIRIGDMEHWFRKSRDQGGLLFHTSLLKNPHWKAFMKEYMYFPNSRHEHILDAMEFTIRYVMRGSPGIIDPSELFKRR